MKRILNSPDEVRLINADHIEFHKLSSSLCSKYETVIEAPELLAGYHNKVAQEETTYKWIRRSEYTEKKAEADHNRDKAYTGLLMIVRANLNHFDPATADDARHVYNLLENYSDLTQKGYDAETAGIDSIVTRLAGDDYAPAVKRLGIMPWITELADRNTVFKSYVDDTTQEQIRKPDVTSGTARRETDEALQKITNRVTALAEINGTDRYAAFAGEFNVLTNHYNTLVRERYGRIHAKTDITPASIASITVQPYTGKPVYVIPQVSIRQTAKDGKETVAELRFSEDFTVSYKNNVAPGTATLVITGIGKYAGELVTTFNIVAEE